MVQALQKRYPAASEYSSTSAESVGVPLASFSVDNELLTSENVVVPTRQKNDVEPQKRWTRRTESAGSYTMIAGQVITFPGLSPSAIGITEGDIEEEIGDNLHYRDILVKTARRVIFAKEISLDPGNMRRLQPKIILDERYLSRDDD
jgi:hypothetical protein